MLIFCWNLKSPQEPDIWDGVRDATILPSKCVQKDILYKMASSASVEGEEDCLYLNVFSPLRVSAFVFSRFQSRKPPY